MDLSTVNRFSDAVPLFQIVMLSRYLLGYVIWYLMIFLQYNKQIICGAIPKLFTMSRFFKINTGIVPSCSHMLKFSLIFIVKLYMIRAFIFKNLNFPYILVAKECIK